jgi:peptide/nickel transport system substrate-binding protein
MSEDERGGMLGDPRTRRQVLQGAAAGSLVLGAGGVLAACGGGATTSSGTGAADTTATGSPATVAELKRGGTLRIGVQAGSNKETQDAHTPNTDPEIAWGYNLYEPVAEQMPDGTFANVLAESIEAKAADHWVIRLIGDVEFHNGKTVTADDLIFSIKRIINPKTASRGGGSLGNIDVGKLKKLDDLTVSISLKAPNVAFPQDFGQYFNGIVPTDYDPKKPVGTGPYKYGSFTAGEQATLLRFDNYRDPQRPYFDELDIIEFADQGARVNALLSGQVDAAAGIPGAQVKTIEATKGLKVLNAKTGLYVPFAMRMDVAPYSDVRVRQAMRLLVNRPQMIQQALGGYGTVGNDMYAPYDPMYAKDIPQRVQDIEQAQSLLKQAGQSDATFEFTAVPFYDGMVESAVVLAQQAKDAGVNIKIKKVTTDQFLANYLNWPFTEGYWGTRDYLPQAAQFTLPGAPLNDTHWKDAEWAKIVLEAQRTLDDAKRAELLHAAQAIEHEKGGMIIWGFSNIVDAYSDKVGGVIPGKIGSFGNYSLSRMGFVA